MTYLKQTARGMAPALALIVACFAAPTGAQAESQPFVGEIAATGNTFCPNGWASAEGQLLAISQNDALFSLFGTIYGGDGRTTFGLPDLRGRTPVGVGQGAGLPNVREGQKGGIENATLTTALLPSHNHAVNVTNDEGVMGGPGGKVLAAGHGDETIYSDQAANRTMADIMIAPTGGGQTFSVIDPTLVIRYCVALFGVYPSRN